MTDKEIIIDGVNVAGCDMQCENGDCALYYAELNSDNTELVYGFNCSDNPNCYYKQLARKTKECERLKIQLMQKSEIDMFFNTPVEGWSDTPCDICEYKQILKDVKSESQAKTEELQAEKQRVKEVLEK